MSLSLRSATFDDLGHLAELNKQLIEDEKSANPMGLGELRERMKRFLETGYHAVLFEQAEEVVGYALYRFEDEVFRERRVVYVRQFFIAQSYRRQGLGREAFAQLRQDYFEDARVRLETLTTNPGGLAFWKRLGFEPHAVTLVLE